MAKTYAQHIEHLANILQGVKIEGLEGDNRGIYAEYLNPRLMTAMSEKGEVTMSVFGDKPVDIDGFLKYAHTSIQFAIYSGSMSNNNKQVLADISRLVNQQVDWIDIYDVLEYLNYELPDRDKWERIVNNDH